MWGVWKTVDCLLNEIRRLEYHPGFPAGVNLRRPVLTIPSLKVPLSLNMDEVSLNAVFESVERFIIYTHI